MRLAPTRKLSPLAAFCRSAARRLAVLLGAVLALTLVLGTITALADPGHPPKPPGKHGAQQADPDTVPKMVVTKSPPGNWSTPPDDVLNGPLDGLLAWIDTQVAKQSSGGVVSGVMNGFDPERGDVWGAFPDPKDKVALRLAQELPPGTVITMHLPGKDVRLVLFKADPKLLEAAEGFWNRLLWQAFHDWENDKIGFRHLTEHQIKTFWRAYQEVNRIVAEGMIAIADTEGREFYPWVHDYQLMLVGSYLAGNLDDAELASTLRPDFFLHIPLSAFKSLVQIVPKPILEDLIERLSGYASIFFQTRRSADHFTAMAKEVGAKVDAEGRLVWPDGRKTVVGVAGIATAPGRFAGVEGSSEATKFADEIQGYIDQKQDPIVMYNADRTDPSKGGKALFEALAMLSELAPDVAKRVIFVANLVKSREKIYADYLTQLDAAIQKARQAGIEIHLYDKSDYGPRVGFEKADILLSPTFNDGMNLTVKEFIQAAINFVKATGQAKGAIPIIGQGAGVAEQLGPLGAPIVDPHDPRTIAEAIIKIARMSPQERIELSLKLQEFISNDTLEVWTLKQFVARIQQVADDEERARQAIADTIAKICQYQGQAAMVCSNNGTLSEFNPNPEEAVPVAGIVQTLTILGEKLGQKVTVVSGSPSDQLVDLYPNQTVVGAFGLVKRDGDQVVVFPALEAVQHQLALAKKLLDDPIIKLSGAFVQLKFDVNGTLLTGLTIHWRNAADQAGREAARKAGYDDATIDAALDKDAGLTDKRQRRAVLQVYRQAFRDYVKKWAGPLDRVASETAYNLGLRSVKGSMARELKPKLGPAANKGAAVLQIARESGAKLVILAVDDPNDLPAARALAKLRKQGVETLLLVVRHEGTPESLVAQADLVFTSPSEFADFLAELNDSLPQGAVVVNGTKVDPSGADPEGLGGVAGATTPKADPTSRQARDDAIALACRFAGQAAMACNNDGTTSDFVPDADAAVPVPGIVGTMESLGPKLGGGVTIASGRPTDYLHQHYPNQEVYGGYGLTWRVGDQIVVNPEVTAAQGALSQAIERVKQSDVVRESGAVIEIKRDVNGTILIGVAMHLRPEADAAGRAAARKVGFSDPTIDAALDKNSTLDSATRDAVRYVYDRAFKDFKAKWEPRLRNEGQRIAVALGLQPAPGNMVVELKPKLSSGGTKREVVLEVARRTGAQLMIVAGDDKGDEASAQALAELRAQGVETILLVVRQEGTPKELLDQADVIFDSPEDLASFLAELDQAMGDANVTVIDDTDDGGDGGEGADDKGKSSGSGGRRSGWVTAPGDIAAELREVLAVPEAEAGDQEDKRAAGDHLDAAMAATDDLLNGAKRTVLDGAGGSTEVDLLRQKVPVSGEKVPEVSAAELGAIVLQPGTQQSHPAIVATGSDGQSTAPNARLAGGGGQGSGILPGGGPGQGGQGGQQQPLPGELKPPGMSGMPWDEPPDPCLQALWETGEVPERCKDLKGLDDDLEPKEAGAVIDLSPKDPCVEPPVDGEVPDGCEDVQGKGDDEEPKEAGAVIDLSPKNPCVEPPADGKIPDGCKDVRRPDDDKPPMNMMTGSNAAGLGAAHPEANGEDPKLGTSAVATAGVSGLAQGSGTGLGVTAGVQSGTGPDLSNPLLGAKPEQQRQPPPTLDLSGGDLNGGDLDKVLDPTSQPTDLDKLFWPPMDRNADPLNTLPVLPAMPGTVIEPVTDYLFSGGNATPEQPVDGSPLKLLPGDGSDPFTSPGSTNLDPLGPLKLSPRDQVVPPDPECRTAACVAA